MPTRGSHRSVRAGLPHTAPQRLGLTTHRVLTVAHLLRHCLLVTSRCRSEQQIPNIGVCFSPQGASDKSPQFNDNIKRSDSQMSIPPSLVLLRSGGTGYCTLSFAPCGGCVLRPRARMLGFRMFRISHVLLSAGDICVSQVACLPLSSRPALATPVGLDDLCQNGHLDSAYQPFKTVGSATNRNFGAQSHGSWTRCLRFAGGVTADHTRLASSLLAKL